MSNYVKATNFTAKDSLLTGNPAKIIKGAEIDDEFNAIATAVATKPDSNSPTFTGVPVAPTATAGSNTTQLATTAFTTAAVTTATGALGTMSTQNANAVAITGGTIAALVLAALYPVGTIYTNASVATNPGTLLGFGTWAAFGTGRVLVGVNSGDTAFDTLEETGGSKTKTLDANNIKHYHGTGNGVSNDDGFFTGRAWSLSSNGTTYSHFIAGETGAASNSSGALTSGSLSTTTPIMDSPTAFDILPPYITVYMWKRTA
jgi:hypothetical protein